MLTINSWLKYKNQKDNMIEYLLKFYFLLSVYTEQLIAVPIFWTYLAKVLKLYFWLFVFEGIGVFLIPSR